MDSDEYDDHVRRWERLACRPGSGTFRVAEYSKSLCEAAKTRLRSMPSDRIERLLDARIFDSNTTLAAHIVLKERLRGRTELPLR